MKINLFKSILLMVTIVMFISCLGQKGKPALSAGNPDDTKAGVPSLDNSIVSLIQSDTVNQATDFTYEEILSMTRRAVEMAGGLSGIVKRGDTVILKPNVVGAFYGWGAGPANPLPMNVNGIATDWRVIQATAVIVREIIGPSGKIILMEGPAAGSSSQVHFNVVGWTKENLTAVDEIIGLESEGSWVGPGQGTSADTQIALPDFDYTRADRSKLSWGTYSYNQYYNNDGKYWVNTKMLTADALISIPVVKTHNAAGGVTGAIKNIGIGAAPPNVYGLNNGSLGRNAMINHSSMVIHDWIADYYRCLPADFVVMDGLQGLADGPGGHANFGVLQAAQKNLRSILASRDPLAIDVVETYIMNWEVPRYLRTLADRVIYARGEIGKENPRVIPHRADTKNIVVLGNRKIDDIRGDQNKVNPGARTASWSGSMSNGGRRLTSTQLAKPGLTIASAEIIGANLNINLRLSTGEKEEVEKIDVYIDEQYIASFNENMHNISLDVSGVPNGERRITIYGFTKYLSHVAANTTVIK